MRPVMESKLVRRPEYVRVFMCVFRQNTFETYHTANQMTLSATKARDLTSY